MKKCMNEHGYYIVNGDLIYVGTTEKGNSVYHSNPQHAVEFYSLHTALKELKWLKARGDLNAIVSASRVVKGSDYEKYKEENFSTE